MQLHRAKAEGLGGIENLFRQCIHKQRNWCDEWWQNLQNRPGLVYRYNPRRMSMKNHADRIGAAFRGSHGVLGPADPANFDPRTSHERVESFVRVAKIPPSSLER
jgi:hypothetical protein